MMDVVAACLDLIKFIRCRSWLEDRNPLGLRTIEQVCWESGVDSKDLGVIRNNVKVGV